MLFLVINPGSTSTKVALYENRHALWTESVRHTPEELAHYERALDQLPFRRNVVLQALRRHDAPPAFDAVIGRGGLTAPVAGGVYEVNRAMLHDCYHAIRQHACNLGPMLAYDIAGCSDPPCKAYTADPGVVDELDDIARITGSPLMPRITIWHALNQRAVARRYAAENNTRYEDIDIIVAHLGGGISVGAHRRGRCVDVNNALDGEGPFSPERAGTLPAADLIELCYSGKMKKAQLKRRIAGQAGLVAHLGTNDVREIERRIALGDRKAEAVLDAMVYQTAKAIAAANVALGGQAEAVLITGGMAHSDYIVRRMHELLDWMAPLAIYPGEDEMDALAENAYLAENDMIAVRKYGGEN